MEDALTDAGRLLLPTLVEAFSLVLMAVIGWAVVVFKNKTGLVIEEQHRDALHRAIMSGVAAASTRLGQGASPALIAQEAIDHARASVPDAIAALKPGIDVLTNIALAKVEAMLGTPKPNVTATINPEGA